jgi:L-2,4-diaminobutyric acid acetyltransferase
MASDAPTRTLTFTHPTVADGAAMWRLAHEVGGLDANTSYAYLLWCRDFSDTSVVARAGDEVVGFTTGYRRPDAPEVLLVWQVAVDPASQGAGVAAGMLDALVAAVRGRGVAHLETTITPQNAASQRLFRSLALRLGAAIEDDSTLFGSDEFPDGHEPEQLIRIGPF